MEVLSPSPASLKTCVTLPELGFDNASEKDTGVGAGDGDPAATPPVPDGVCGVCGVCGVGGVGDGVGDGVGGGVGTGGVQTLCPGCATLPEGQALHAEAAI